MTMADELDRLQESLLQEVDNSASFFGSLPSEPLVLRKERHTGHRKAGSVSQLNVLNSPPAFRLPRGSRHTEQNKHRRFHSLNSFDSMPETPDFSTLFPTHEFETPLPRMQRRSSSFSINSQTSQLMTPHTNGSLEGVNDFSPAIVHPDLSISSFIQPTEFAPPAAALNFEGEFNMTMRHGHHHRRVASEELSRPLQTMHLEDDKDDVSEGELETKDEPTQCRWESCSLEFGNIDELVKHISDVHIGSGQNSYTCRWEGCTRAMKPFSKRHKIQNHVRIHTGERPFACHFADCGKKFSRQDGLNTHIKTHSNVKPFICDYAGCGKAYFHARSLRKHERSHSASYPTKENAGYQFEVPQGTQQPQVEYVSLISPMTPNLMSPSAEPFSFNSQSYVVDYSQQMQLQTPFTSQWVPNGHM